MMQGKPGRLLRLRHMAALAVLVACSGAYAQTPPAACGAGSLVLVTPEALSLRLGNEGRRGLTISWPDLDRDLATCVTLNDTLGLGFNVLASGGFGDRVDRQLLFTAVGTGTIGAVQPQNLVVKWVGEGPSTYGTLAGELNLSNNGGIWNWSATNANWTQANAGLPMTWRQTNVTALARGSGSFMVASFTRGTSLQSDPTGLYAFDGARWQRLASDIFGASTVVTGIAISPGSNQRFAVGTLSRGLFVTADGGQTFTQWTGALDPSVLVPPTNFKVTALEWTTTHLYAALAQFGVFVSANDGLAFAKMRFKVPANLDVPGAIDAPDSLKEWPSVEDFAVDPNDPDHVVAALLFHGCYETFDAGQTWHNLYGDLVVPSSDPLIRGAWVKSGAGVVIDAVDRNTIVLGIKGKGLYRTTDGGVTWLEVGRSVQPVTNLGKLLRFSLLNVPGTPGAMAVMEDGHGLLRSDDSGATWAAAAVQPVINTGTFLVPGPDAAGDLTLATWGGGIYQAEHALALSETYTSETSQELRGLNLGLSLTFDDGAVATGDIFRLVAQTFQGWAVWRSSADHRDNMTLIGLYDRVNPEDCIRGYCGDASIEIIPRCFAAKRAACFTFTTPDTVRFFDEEVYNGFGYYYAVTSYDYGNAALSTPQSNAAAMLFSSRWDADSTAAYPGPGNRTYIVINEGATAPVSDEEIYAFPNPVRRGAGFSGDEGVRVGFTNLPAGARVRIFTTAGDDVADLGPELQTGGQIYWDTANREGESVAAGVYIYKVEMPARSDYWGRIVVIR